MNIFTAHVLSYLLIFAFTAFMVAWTGSSAWAWSLALLFCVSFRHEVTTTKKAKSTTER